MHTDCAFLGWKSYSPSPWVKHLALSAPSRYEVKWPAQNLTVALPSKAPGSPCWEATDPSVTVYYCPILFFLILSLLAFPPLFQKRTSILSRVNTSVKSKQKASEPAPTDCTHLTGKQRLPWPFSKPFTGFTFKISFGSCNAFVFHKSGRELQQT